ncbi:unnamed protein product, partial [Rotaria magnacalcarata]
FQYEKIHVIGVIGEIGVHHGKFTCYLFLLRRSKKQILFAVDVFEQQYLNKDKSGRGSLTVFRGNLRDYANLHEKDVTIYAGSSLDLNPKFSNNNVAISWWKNEVVGHQGLQLVSVDGGHTALLTYSDVCLVSNGMLDGGVVLVDDIVHPGWMGVRDGVGRFLDETSQLLTDHMLENQLAYLPNQTSIQLSKRIIEATTRKHENRKNSQCSRLVPFLLYANKLFLTTPNFYPLYIDLIANISLIHDEITNSKIRYLAYNSLRYTIGNVPVWIEQEGMNTTARNDLFKRYIEPNWLREIAFITKETYKV